MNDHKWMKYEKLFFRLTLGLLTFGLFLASLAILLVDELETVGEGVIGALVTFLYIHIGLFVFYIGRIIKYFAMKKDIALEYSVVRTFVNILLSPISFLIYWFVLLMIGLSQCSIS